MPTVSDFGAFPKDAFRDLVASLHPLSPVQWVGDPRKFPGPKNGRPGELLELDVTRRKHLGWEDTTKTYNETLDCQAIAYSGHQVVTISFRLDSYSFDHPAYDELSRLVLKFRRQTTLDQLAGMSVAYAGKHDIVPLTVRADTRFIYSAIVEMDFNFLAFEQDDTATGTVVATVNGNNVVPANPPLAPTGA